MAFIHGKNTEIYCNGYNLTSYLNSIDTTKIVDITETSTFGNNSKNYIAGLQDGTVSVEGYYDGSSNAIDEVLNAALGASESEWCYYPAGDTFDNLGYALQTVNNSISLTSDIGDATTISGEAQSKVGTEKIISLHALSQVTSSGEGSGHDGEASSSDGGSAYIQVTDVTGTVEVIIQHDSNSDFSTATTLASFTAIDTDHTSERITFSGTVNRYVRAKWTLGGGETLTFNIGFNRG
jgi:hypothetical protein